jgi:hypothetical protein
VKCSAPYKGGGLRLTIYRCYSWKTGLNKLINVLIIYCGKGNKNHELGTGFSVHKIVLLFHSYQSSTVKQPLLPSRVTHRYQEPYK